MAFWAFLHSHPHLLLPYQITWASFINVELLDGGGWCPAGICEGVSFAQKWTIPGVRLGTKQLSLAAALVCVSCLTKWKRDGGWSESYGERKPLLTLCIFNINVIKAVRQTSLPGWREAGRAPAKKLECVGGQEASLLPKVGMMGQFMGQGVKPPRPVLLCYPVALTGPEKVHFFAYLLRPPISQHWDLLSKIPAD